MTHARIHWHMLCLSACLISDAHAAVTTSKTTKKVTQTTVRRAPLAKKPVKPVVAKRTKIPTGKTFADFYLEKDKEQKEAIKDFMQQLMAEIKDNEELAARYTKLKQDLANAQAEFAPTREKLSQLKQQCALITPEVVALLPTAAEDAMLVQQQESYESLSSSVQDQTKIQERLKQFQDRRAELAVTLNANPAAAQQARKFIDTSSFLPGSDIAQQLHANLMHTVNAGSLWLVDAFNDVRRASASWWILGQALLLQGQDRVGGGLEAAAADDTYFVKNFKRLCDVLSERKISEYAPTTIDDLLLGS